MQQFGILAKIIILISLENTAEKASDSRGQVWFKTGDQRVSALAQEKCSPRSRLKSSGVMWETELPQFMFLSLNTKHCFPCLSGTSHKNNCTGRVAKCKKIFLSSRIWKREYLYKNQFTSPILFNSSANAAEDLCLVKTVPFHNLASLLLDFAVRSQSCLHDFILCF